MPNISLNSIIDINVSVSPTITLRQGFNVALIVGSSTKITALERIREYSNLAEMLVGTTPFTIDSVEYKAAAVYFAQSPKPSKLIVGVKETGEELLAAITACRVANSEWYVCIPTEDLVAAETTAKLVAISTYIESVVPASIVAYTFTGETTEDASIAALKSGKFNRTFSQFDDVSENVNNDGKTQIAGIIGYAMGYNKTLKNSFNLAYKPVAGIDSVKFLTEQELTEKIAANTNVYVNQGHYYDVFRQGKMAGGSYFDEVLYLDMLINEIKSSVMDRLVSLPKIPQTNDGVNVLTNSISVALDKFVDCKFIQPGVWLGEDIAGLRTGDVLSSGYLIMFDDVNTQSALDRTARLAPNCFVVVKLAGSIEFAVINLDISR